MMAATAARPPSTMSPVGLRLTRESVETILGRLPDATLVAVLATGATQAELLEARALAADDSLVAVLGRQPSERVIRLTTLLKADDSEWDD